MEDIKINWEEKVNFVDDMSAEIFNDAFKSIQDGFDKTKKAIEDNKADANETYISKQEAADTYATKKELSEHNDTASKTYANKEEVANAVKGTASGEIIRITDISPIEHTLVVKLSSDTVTDFSDVELNVKGNNLIDFFDITAQQDVTYITSEGLERNISAYLIDNLVAGESYTISFDFKDSTKICKYLYFFERNKTTLKAVSSLHFTTETIIRETYTFVAKENCDYVIYRGGTYTLSQSEINKFSSFQVELGEVATEYEPFIKPVTYTANANGTVDGVKSVNGMILSTGTDGVVVNAEYNQDTNKAMEKIKEEVTNIGNNINTALDEILEIQNSLIGGDNE